MQSLLESCDRGGFNPFHLVHNIGNNCEALACLSCQPEEDIPPGVSSGASGESWRRQLTACGEEEKCTGALLTSRRRQRDRSAEHLVERVTNKICNKQKIRINISRVLEWDLDNGVKYDMGVIRSAASCCTNP